MTPAIIVIPVPAKGLFTRSEGETNIDISEFTPYESVQLTSRLTRQSFTCKIQGIVFGANVGEVVGAQYC